VQERRQELAYRGIAGALIAAALLVGCDPRPAPLPVDSPAVPGIADSIVAPAEGRSLRGWNPAAGELLIVAGGAEISVVIPWATDSVLRARELRESEVPAGGTYDLFARSGRVGRAELQAVAPPVSAPACTAWPSPRLGGPEWIAADRWTVALRSGLARPLPLDSLEGLAGADSARLVAEVARLSSTLAGDTSAAFRGLPFQVRQVRRFAPAPGVQALAAQVFRRMASEATPFEEQIFVIAERRGTSGRYTPVYHERVTGDEETVESTEALAAFTIVEGESAAMVLLRDYGTGTRYSLLQRGSASWSVSWSSAYAGC
jgi:hypothetical protein